MNSITLFLLTFIVLFVGIGIFVMNFEHPTDLLLTIIFAFL